MKLILVGGFLGSGKTTAILNACQLLMKEGKKVAVITNDQGDQQVDSAFIKSFGIPTREVSNGCFCCNYDQLDEHLQSFNSHQPDIIFAESVGSCTDLIATIAKPLNKVKPEIEVVIAVFADADLLCSFIENRSSFLEESVRYIFKKQLEEADVLIINKSDLLSPNQLATVGAILKSEYSDKTILYQNSLLEKDISAWIEVLNQFKEFKKRSSLDIDYDLYGKGESRLAWLDKSITIHTSDGTSIFVAHKIIGRVFDQIQAHHLTIGHLKFFLEADDWKEKISFTTTSTSADLRITNINVHEVKVLINARVQTEPEKLLRLIDEVVANAERTYGCSIITAKWSAFKPGYPKPTHRITID